MAPKKITSIGAGAFLPNKNGFQNIVYGKRDSQPNGQNDGGSGIGNGKHINGNRYCNWPYPHLDNGKNQAQNGPANPQKGTPAIKKPRPAMAV